MQHQKQATLKFSNHRDWHEYLAELQCSGPCPRVMRAFSAGRAWISNTRIIEDVAPHSWLAMERLAR